VAHVDLLHLLLNMSYCWSLGDIELLPGRGSGYYLRTSLVSGGRQ
jgi:membrane associated rhomboid family serine protease